MMAMGPRERLLTAVTGGQADRTPVIIPGGMMSATLEPLVVRQGFSYPQIHTQPDVMARFARRLQETCRLDNVGAPLCMTVEAEAFGAGVDLGSHRMEPQSVRDALSHLSGAIIHFGRAQLTAGADLILIADPSAA
jgi:[methyl-Co(III) methanol-specific corrinoid protein]:coenzyme M methyltransferase